MTKFAHPSEEEFARVLDHYGIEWEYEQKTFVLKRDENGATRRALCPDFYIPEEDVYVELSTQKQKLNTRKHRKIRLAMEKYGVTIIFMNKTAIENFRKKYAHVLDTA